MLGNLLGQSSRDLAGPVVEEVDSAIHRINLYPVDSAIGFPNTYPLVSGVSVGLRYPTFEKLIEA